VTLLQPTPKSRSDIKQYGDIEAEVTGLIGKVNGRFGDAAWTPIRYVNRSYSRSVLAGLYRAALCWAAYARCSNPRRNKRRSQPGEAQYFWMPTHQLADKPPRLDSLGRIVSLLEPHRWPRRALSRQISVGHFRRRISLSAAIREQKQWGSIPRRSANWQYRI
jgi:hypothetical protein